MLRRLVTAVAVVVAPDVASAQDRGWDWRWGVHPMPWMWGVWGFAMMIMMVAFWAVVVTGLVMAIRWLGRHGPASRSDRAIEILRERYARGEIDRQEFEAKLRDLR